MKHNILLLIALLGSGCVMAEPQMKVTFHVTDAVTNDVLTNAQVMVYNNGWETKKVDSGGFCSFEGEAMSFGWKGHIKLDGFYDDSSGAKYAKINRVLNRWEPWNPVIEVKMRPIRHPVPMVVKRVESLKIPEWDKLLGFDLEKGDWVAPYGKGVHSDYFVNMHRRFSNSNDYEAKVQITFPNEGDGIQFYNIPEEIRRSSYLFPYLAPDSGYQNKLILQRTCVGGKDATNFDPTKSQYIFRVRTQLDQDGNIVSACYGRVDRRIEIGWGEVFDFEYHFNPDPTSRSLEYNGVNLLKK